MGLFSNLDLLSVGVVIAATGILGFVVFFNNPKSTTSQTFLVFCLLTIGWGSLNYLSYHTLQTELAFILLRFSIFIAVWHSLFLFQLLYVFPEDKFVFPKSYQAGLLPLVLAASLLNLSSFTFNHVAGVAANGQITKVANGPGIILFTLIILGLIISGILVLVKKIRAKNNIAPQQARPILFGIIATFALILIFNFIFPAFLNNSHYISLGALFIFPFIVGTSYSIFKHQLLNVKVVSTEILTFILALVILLQVVTSSDLTSLLFSLSVFLLVVCLGILLIKSVIKEVKQREQLEILSKQLDEANQKLKALDLARAEFISIASHQLRTPPATIKWYLSSILTGDYGKVPKKLEEQLKKTQNTNNHLISLIEDMLNVSRIERGKMEFLFEPTQTEELAKFASEQLMPIAQDKKLKLIYEPPTKLLPKILADKEKLRQVMNNLIDNALKYTKEGSVTVKLSGDKNEIRFSVEDTGKGITQEERASIFEKFTRGKESIKQSAGLGLGLYVAKIIVEQHKGKIWAESAGEGKGSVFIFTLPVKTDLKQTTLVDFAPKQNAPQSAGQ